MLILEIIMGMLITALFVGLLLISYLTIGIFTEEWSKNWLQEDKAIYGKNFNSPNSRIKGWPKAVLIAIIIRKEYIKNNPKETISFKQIYKRWRNV